MKAKSFKKFFASIALSAVLTFSTAATAFAATAQLMPVEQSAELSQEQTDTPSVDDSDAQATGASYLTSQAGIAQIAASESSVTVQWTPVTNAAKYAISISPFSSGSYKLLGYFDNSRNKVRITALTSSGTSISSRIAGCTTLYSRVTVKTSYASAGGYTFNMNTVNPANSISGYKVIYQSSATHKLITKYYSRPSFTLPLNKNTFYQVRIYPYLLLNNKRYVTTTPTTRYISMGIVLQKAGNTNSTMKVKWNKVAGANNYAVYIKYPGTGSYKKVRTTTSTSFTLTNMTKNVKYGIKVIANKRAGGKTWKSAANAYTMSLSGR